MAAQPTNDWGKKWSQIVAKAWTDEAFKTRLLADPAAVLTEHGMEVPPGVRCRVMEDTATLRHLTLPLRPGSRETSEEDLLLLGAVGGLTNASITSVRDR